ncbi:hypothetical protein OPV22_011350 [Ensete ventricosum]|uniref:Uncharacterized protein n=1 Tax=Ensete ventricosum TaxID=4639 RepID=A0AAV8R9H1_ENSVE|nr:hypothetical protein OPV22_011350 [Ensete ventricosum]
MTKLILQSYYVLVQKGNKYKHLGAGFLPLVCLCKTKKSKQGERSLRAVSISRRKTSDDADPAVLRFESSNTHIYLYL